VCVCSHKYATDISGKVFSLAQAGFGLADAFASGGTVCVCEGGGALIVATVNSRWY